MIQITSVRYETSDKKHQRFDFHEPITIREEQTEQLRSFYRTTFNANHVFFTINF